MKESLQKFALVLAAILLFSLGCVQQPQIHDIGESGFTQGITFGKLELIKDGKVVSWSSFWMGREGRIIFLPPSGNKAIVYKVDKDGFFSWALEPGNYLILGYDLTEGGNVTSGDLRISFNVSDKTKNVYIGNLKVDLQEGWYKIDVYDDSSTAVELFRNKFPNAEQPVKELAQLQEDIGTFKNKKYVCAEYWGTDCKNKSYGLGFMRFEGVKPIKPEVTIKGQTKLDNLLPTFEWSPSSVDNISYDLVVYEAVSFSRSGIDIQYKPGRLVLYKEDIRESKYELKDPLKPGSRYFWSIRLRLNDDVSTWSKYAFFQTIILVTEGGRNNWFSFETP